MFNVIVGLARTIYIRCIYGIFCRDFIKYTVIYGVYIRFWPTLQTLHVRTEPDAETGGCDDKGEDSFSLVSKFSQYQRYFSR